MNTLRKRRKSESRPYRVTLNRTRVLDRLINHYFIAAGSYCVFLPIEQYVVYVALDSGST